MTEAGEHYECEHCGWVWPLPTEPPADAECDNCGDDEFVRWVDLPATRGVWRHRAPSGVQG